MKMKKPFNIHTLVFIFLIAFSLGSVYYLLLPGFYEPHDLHHIADIYQMYRAIISGQMPPRWGPDYLNFFGYPLFNFYYVGPFYLGALFYFITGSLRFSFELIFITGVILGAVGFYLFLKNHFSKLASFAGAVLFTYTPYKAVQIYVRGAMGEFLSVSLMPLFLYFTEKYLVEGKRKWFIFSVMISAFIILSHNYFWVVILGFCGIYFAIGSIINKRPKILRNFFLETLFSLGITIYWWLPALIEQKLLKIQTPFPLIDHFPFIKQLIIPSWGYGASVWGPMDGMSFQLGIVNMVAVVLAILLIALLKTKKNKKNFSIIIWAISSFFLCLFFMNIRSYFIWKAVPFYNLFQFPWRLLAFTGFFSPILAAVAIDRFFDADRKLLGKFTTLLFLMSSVVLTINYFKPSKIFYKKDSDYLKRMFASQAVVGNNQNPDEYETYSEDYLLLPKWVSEKPINLSGKKFTSADVDSVEVKAIREVTPVLWEAEVTVNTPGQLEFNSLYFPGWVALADGKKTNITYGDLGQIVINLNAGDSLVRVYWAETSLRKIADIVSLIFIFVLIGLSFWKNDDHREVSEKYRK